MSGQELLIILLVGLVAGWLAGQIVQGRPKAFPKLLSGDARSQRLFFQGCTQAHE